MVVGDGSGRYEIHVSADKRLILDKLIGYWDVATAERFVEEFHVAIRKVAAAGPGWKILANHEEFEIQPPEIAAILMQNAAYAMANGLAKAAVYMPGAISRLQIKRMGTAEKIRTFASEEEARAWLDE
jgi:hypothetical protein